MSTITTGKKLGGDSAVIADRLEEVRLPELALRLALCSHIHVPNENEFDHLVEKVFAPKQSKKGTAKISLGEPILTTACTKTLATV